VAAIALTGQERFRGTVVNRDGTPQPGCRVEFFWDAQASKLAVDAYTDDYGYFYLNGPPHGDSFTVTVSLRGRSFRIEKPVSIDQNGITPPTLVVDW
jgi:hypothetical protein